MAEDLVRFVVGLSAAKLSEISATSFSPRSIRVDSGSVDIMRYDSGIPWAHLDVMAWNPRSRPGRPEGAEATALRALYAHIAQRFV